MPQGADVSPASSSGLLVAGDPEPVAVENLTGSSRLLLIGDHAGREVPARLGDLGVGAADLERHIAWDIGVAGLGAILSRRLDAAFIRQSYSRLVIDCNRTPGTPGSTPPVSDGVKIPANEGLGLDDLEVRRREIFAPYHDRIAQVLDQRRAAGRPTILVSLHSFTPTMDGFDRPWRFGVLHRGDSAFSRRVLAALRAGFGDAVGDNQPYALNDTDFTVPRHADAYGLDYLELEVRQDLLANGDRQARIADILTPVLARASLNGA